MASTKDKIPFYVFDKSIAYSPRKKGEKVTFKDTFDFEGLVTFVALELGKKRMVVKSFNDATLAYQIFYIDGDEIDKTLKHCLLNRGRMYGKWNVYRKGNKILLRYADYPDNPPAV